jgi:subfamily B ATP-binding cassette protein MsbA
MENRLATIKKLTIRELLKPHVTALTIGFIAVVGEGVANLLEPWPLRIVLDSVLRSRPTNGWLNHFIQSTVCDDKFAILKFACVAVLGIAALDAVSSYTEKYFTTSVGQWVTHDLRRTLYSRIQQLSLAYHDQKRSGDDQSAGADEQYVKAYQYCALGADQPHYIGGHDWRDVLNWRFSCSLRYSGIFRWFDYRIKNLREVRKETELFRSSKSAILIRVVKAFAREVMSAAPEEESLEREIGLRARLTCFLAWTSSSPWALAWFCGLALAWC